MCGRPICPDCMTPTQVGMRCPECAGQKTEVRRMSTLSTRPTATITLIVINVIVFLVEIGGGSGLVTGVSGSVYTNGALWGPAVHFNQEYYRLITYSFLHAGILHIGLNLYFLYYIGRILEPAIGKTKFVSIYFASALAGAFGALLITPNSPTVGASGAIFGLLGAAFITQHLRGLDPMRSGIGALIVINLVLSFLITGISIGGHIGGLVGGLAAGFMVEHLERRQRSVLLSVGACALVGVVSIVGAILCANAGV
jgi:membrane associated rhomboid family serine protease